MLGVDESHGVLSEKRHVFCKIKRLVAEIIVLYKLSCMSKLLCGPLSINLANELVLSTKHRCNWI